MNISTKSRTILESLNKKICEFVNKSALFLSPEYIKNLHSTQVNTCTLGTLVTNQRFIDVSDSEEFCTINAEFGIKAQKLVLELEPVIQLNNPITKQIYFLSSIIMNSTDQMMLKKSLSLEEKSVFFLHLDKLCFNLKNNPNIVFLPYVEEGHKLEFTEGGLAPNKNYHNQQYYQYAANNQQYDNYGNNHDSYNNRHSQFDTNYWSSQYDTTSRQPY